MTIEHARLERTFDAPASLIWELLTTAAGLERWWAPDGFESRISEVDLLFGVSQDADGVGVGRHSGCR